MNNMTELPHVEIPSVKLETLCAVNDVRHYLYHPFLDLSDPDKPMLVATNGHLFTACEVKVHGAVTRGPIPCDAIKAARQEHARRNRGRRQHTGEPAAVFFEGDRVGTDTVMFKRPCYEDIFKDRPDGNATGWVNWRAMVAATQGDTDDIGIDAALLYRLSRAMYGGRTKGLGVVLSIGRDKHGQLDPRAGLQVRWLGRRGDQDPEAIAVVMPMRT